MRPSGATGSPSLAKPLADAQRPPRRHVGWALCESLLYTHALGIDQPPSIIRMGYVSRISTTNVVVATGVQFPAFAIVPFWENGGQPTMGIFPDSGKATRCKTASGRSHCVYLQWPARYLGYERQTGSFTSFWHGTLLFDKRDAAGLNYRRNRYYDAATGRFTQEDPIGLAGGLNVYGFASGDPVNFSDPFGLCPPQDSDMTTCLGFWTVMGEATGALVGAAIGGSGGAAGGAALCTATVVGAPAAPLCGAAGGAAGAVAGAAKGAVVGGAIGAVVDGLVLMASASKGRGGNDKPNADANRIARENGLNRAGQRALHDEITGQDLGLEEIREIAARLANQTKYLQNPPSPPNP